MKPTLNLQKEPQKAQPSTFSKFQHFLLYEFFPSSSRHGEIIFLARDTLILIILIAYIFSFVLSLSR